MNTRDVIGHLVAVGFLAFCGEAAFAQVRADSLLSVDQNRTEIVEGLVAKWKDHLASGRESDLKKTLMGLRADKLLAISLAQDQTQFAALLEKDSFLPVKRESPAETGGEGSVVHAKALGDANTDVVYVPVTPCRLFYTEIASGGAGGALLPGVPRTFDTRGSLTGQGGAAGCSLPTTATAIVMQMGAFSSFGLGWINAGPQGLPIPAGVLMAYNNVAFINATSVTLKINPTNGQFSAISNNNRTELYGDVLGYFAAPSTGNGLRVVQTTGTYTDAPNIINGSANNSASGQGATVVGGGRFGSNCFNPSTGLFNRPCGNRALADFATVGGGQNNTASGSSSTVSGGANNTASSASSLVAGGSSNNASGDSSTVAGGVDNTASGFFSTVVGGGSNTASGNYSFAAGFRARANAGLCAVFNLWSTLQSMDCLGSANVFRIGADRGFSVEFASQRADGGGTRWVYIGDGFANQQIATSTGAFLSAAGVWTNASDRSLKEHFAPVNARAMLAKVVSLPISAWSYKADNGQVRHIGPMAQDFKRVFGIGQDDRSIGTVDADGVALAAIQGLHQVVKEKDAKISALQRANDAMQRELAAIKRKLGL